MTAPGDLLAGVERERFLENDRLGAADLPHDAELARRFRRVGDVVEHHPELERRAAPQIGRRVDPRPCAMAIAAMW